MEEESMEKEKVVKMEGHQDEMMFKDPYESKLSPVSDLKRKLLENYRKSHPALFDKVERTNAGFNTDQLLNAIIADFMMAAEELFGNILLTESNGDIQSSSNIIYKRADLLKLAADIVSKKKELNQRNGEVDLNSPVFILFQKICFEKLVLALQEVKVQPEMVNLILSAWQDKLQNWDKELKKALKELEE